MDENYEAIETTEETMRNDVVELLTWLKDEIMSAPTSTITETGRKSSSEFSQRVDAYDKFYKLYLADQEQEFDQGIQDADRERKNCEYLENVAKRTEELKLRSRELDLREKELENNGRIKEREIDIRADEFKLKENDLKFRGEELDSDKRLKSRELDIRERENDIREMTARESGRWWNKPIIQTVAICGTTLIVNGVALYLNASEAPLKNIFERWMIKPKL